MPWTLDQLKGLSKTQAFPCQRVDSLGHKIVLASWVRDWGGVTANAKGVTGWAKIGTDDPPFRMHICAYKPCSAMHCASKYGMYGAPVHYEWCPDHKWTADTAVDASVVADGIVAEILSPPITEPQVDLPAQTELHEGVPTAGSETEQGAQVGGPSENPNLATVVEGVALSGASANCS